MHDCLVSQHPWKLHHECYSHWWNYIEYDVDHKSLRIHIEGQGKQGKAQELIHDENWSMILLQSDMSMWFHHLLGMWAWNSSSFAKFCLIWLEEVERITPSLFGAKECLQNKNCSEGDIGPFSFTPLSPYSEWDKRNRDIKNCSLFPSPPLARTNKTQGFRVELQVSRGGGVTG